MSIRKRVILFYFSFLFVQGALTQDKTSYTFGKIVPSDFILKENIIDSGANAVIIADIGSTSFEGNNQGFFTLVFKRFIRVKILNKNGYDIGSFRLFLYHQNDDFEKLNAIKGSTFNLENGKVTETKLEETSVYTVKYNRNFDIKMISMPALKEGAIYDLEYTIKSPFNTKLKSWAFQSEYPCHWSEYKVTIPPPFHYMKSIQGDTSFYINSIREVFTSYVMKYENGPYQNRTYSAKGNSLEQRWVKKDLPPLHKDAFITSLKNYYSQVSFQLNYFQWETGYGKNDRIDYLENWNSASKTLLQEDDFGHVLNYENNWMKDDLGNLAQGASSTDEKARVIFAFVRDNFKTIGQEGYNENSIRTLNSLKDVFKKKQGNVAEINLLLTAILRHENIRADPLILSTRDNGIANATYPLIDEYNYVICIAYPDDKMVVLDASQPFNGYGQLPVSCYNGYGHILNLDNPQPFLFNPDSILEASMVSVFITNDERNKISGTYKKTFGKAESYEIRKEINNTDVSSYENKIKIVRESDLVIDNFGIDSLNKFEPPLSVHYDFELRNGSNENVFYFNPILDEGDKVNPFKSVKRYFPVEIPYKMDKTYLLNMEIPAGYQVEEIPKSVKVGFNGQEGLFEYLIQKNENNLQMRVRLKLDKTYFTMEEYSDLRNFFAFVEKKENEQIVFRKIK